MDWEAIIDKYYPSEGKLRAILITHSAAVARRAIVIAERHPELSIDRRFVEEAAMLHDIGIIACDAPGIECFGSEPYIRHGVIGAAMLRSEGYPLHARVCERHTGAGLTLESIVAQQLPLPHASLVPESLEEELICYADKFYSKSHLDCEKTQKQVIKSLAKYGDEGVRRFLGWAAKFE